MTAAGVSGKTADMRRVLPGLTRLLFLLALFQWSAGPGLGPAGGSRLLAPIGAPIGIDAPVCGADGGHASPDNPSNHGHHGCGDLCCRLGPELPGLAAAARPVPHAPAFRRPVTTAGVRTRLAVIQPPSRPQPRAPPAAVL